MLYTLLSIVVLGGAVCLNRFSSESTRQAAPSGAAFSCINNPGSGR